MFYKRHIFFCTNKKSSGGGCGSMPAEEAFEYAKMYLQCLDMWGDNKFRASKSGCLGQCDYGPICVVYPDGVWYSYVDQADVKEILDSHVLKGKIVSRLQLKPQLEQKIV